MVSCTFIFASVWALPRPERLSLHLIYISCITIPREEYYTKFVIYRTIVFESRGSYRGIFVMRDYLILFSVKREFRKLFFVTRDLKVLRDP